MGIFDWWRKPANAGVKQDRQAVAEAIDRVVATTNPRLKFARRYRERLAPAVEAALAYTDKLVNSLPAVREASTAAWGSDPYMQAYFATADDLVQAFSRAPELRAFFEGNPGLAEVHGALGMRLTERKVLGMAMEGDQLRGEVSRTTVSFSDHRIRICGLTEAELRAEIGRRLLDQLALEGLARVVADQSNREELEQDRAMLKVRLQMLERKGTGMRGALGGEAVGQDELARLQSQLEENTVKLGAGGGGARVLERELDLIAGVLAEPAPQLFVSRRRLRMDKLNVVWEGDGPSAGAEFEFVVGRIPAITPPEIRSFALVRFPRAELLPLERLHQDAARHL